MDSDEVLRLKQINGLQALFADRRFSKLDCEIATTKPDARLPLTASILVAKQRRISLCGKGSAQNTDSGIAATPTSVVSHWQNSTSLSEETAL